MSSPREAVAVFRSAQDLEAAIDDLLSNGFNCAVSVVRTFGTTCGVGLRSAGLVLV